MGGIERILREHRENKARLRTALALIKEMSAEHRAEVVDYIVTLEKSGRANGESGVETAPVRGSGTDAESGSDPGATMARRAVRPRVRRTTLRDLVEDVLRECTSSVGSGEIADRVIDRDSTRKKPSVVAEIHRMTKDGVLREVGSNGRAALYALASDSASLGHESVSAATSLEKDSDEVRKAIDPFSAVLRDSDLGERERPEMLSIDVERAQIASARNEIIKLEARARSASDPSHKRTWRKMTRCWRDVLERHERRLRAAELALSAPMKVSNDADVPMNDADSNDVHSTESTPPGAAETEPFAIGGEE